MYCKRFCLPLILSVLFGAACATDMQGLLSEDATRSRAIEVLVSDPSMRGEIVDGLLGNTDARTDLFGKIVEDEESGGALIEQMMQSERAKAVAASRIASDYETTRTFIGMMMLSGSVGGTISRAQADCLELGDALTHGNQRRTMTDLKRLGGVVDDWARKAGTYPVCLGFENVTKCLASRLPDDALADLRLSDAWGRPFLYHSDEEGKTYALISYATDGEYDGLGKVGPTSSYNSDIVFADGEFVQWPAHIRREKIR